MNVSDLMAELKQFGDLATVFIQTDDGKIHRLDSTHAIWVKSSDGTGLHGPYTEVDQDAEDFGVLLYA